MSFNWHQPQLDALLADKVRLPHALLFRGPQGIGKLALAEALAAALLCERPGPNRRACGKCAGCGWMGQGSHPDFRRLEPEILTGSRDTAEEGDRKKPSQEIKIEQVRAIEDFINVTSHRGGSKVVLIHPAEALNINAANALLKNLEEPPPATYFVLVSHHWHLLPATIMSRCRQVPLPLPPKTLAQDWLSQQGVREPELALAQAGGAPLLAAGLDEEYWRQRALFLKSIAGTQFDALGLAEQVRELPPALIVGWLQKWAFDLARCKVTGEVRYNPDFAAPIATAAAKLDAVELTRYLRHVVRQQRIVSHPLNARLFLEQLLLEYSALLKGRPEGRVA